jgi:hypothetical protein
MKIKVIPSDPSIATFELDVVREYGRGCMCQYGVKDKTYKGFQFDDIRPTEYERGAAQARSYHGYMIGKKGKQTIECYIRVIYADNERVQI